MSFFSMKGLIFILDEVFSMVALSWGLFLASINDNQGAEDMLNNSIEKVVSPRS